MSASSAHIFVKADLVTHKDGWEGEITNISRNGKLGFVGRWLALDELTFSSNADEDEAETGRTNYGHKSAPSIPHEPIKK